MEKFMFMFIFQKFLQNFCKFLPIFLKFKNSYFQGTTFFFWIKIRRFLKQKTERFRHFRSFWLKMNFRKMASNRHVDMRKIENFVRSKGKTATFRKPCKNFKIFDEILTYKEKRWVIFGNDRNIFNLSTTIFYR